MEWAKLKETVSVWRACKGRREYVACRVWDKSEALPILPKKEFKRIEWRRADGTTKMGKWSLA